jgi:hypothetical protein
MPFHGVSQKSLQRYLDEFVFRIDRRWRERESSSSAGHTAPSTLRRARFTN